jgi:hypothetical protein
LIEFYHCRFVTKKSTPRLDTLLDKVERLCKNKSALARELGVSSQHIQKWVTAREYEPGGEITLQLLEWVSAEEAKQNKNRSRASTPLRRKTRLTKSNHEKRKPSPRKK